ncbi:T5orf172 domain-containing protein [Chaetomium tenue]|uniref:T5orf172 domain-containing protein n=1 Tax=Chaetomium tenue TaxID=1854479 RepID=A0ACB7P3E4_9PEZI|nr:T5orf172 domain-containing protein [Chaetomium globosum]
MAINLIAMLPSLWNFVRHGIQRRGLWTSSASTPDPQDLHPAPIPVNEPPTTVDNTSGPPSPSQPIPPLTTEPPEHTNRTIANLLQNAAGLLTTTTTTPAKPGFIYILTATHNRNNSTTPLIKIGHTTQPIPTRLAAMQRSCPNLRLKILPLTPSPSPSTTSSSTSPTPSSSSSSSSSFTTPHPRLTEKLAHAELASTRYAFRCPDCGSRHREFFAVEAGVARRVVERWVRFCGGLPGAWEVVSESDGSGNGGVRLAAPWRGRLEGFEGRGLLDAPVPVLAGKEGVETGMALWDGFVDAGVGAWVWYDVCRAGGVLWEYLLWVVVVGLAVDGAFWCRSVGLAALGWVMLGLVVAVLALTALRLPMGSTYTWATLSKGLLWLSAVVALMSFAGASLYLGWEPWAWVLTWMLVGVLMCMVLVLMGFRCVTAEYLCKWA